MANRKRDVQILFCVTAAEKEIIKYKMKLAQMQNMSEFLRKMAMHGNITNLELSDIKSFTKEVNQIGVNVHQITKRVNGTNIVYKQDLKDIIDLLSDVKEILRKTWQSLTSILSP